MSSESGAANARPLPLDGVRVVDFTQVMMGPCCTQMLGDYGADVIKIERVGSGDLSRWSVGEDPDGGNNPVFASLNRNKRSVALNLKSDEDRAAALRLVETADVVVNNFRPGVMERMGFGYEELRRVNPRIIYAVGTGFGLEGPYVHKGGQDVLAQAMSGSHAPPRGPGDCALRLPPPRSRTTPPACTWCRASCSRCCTARRPARDSRSRSRSTTPCSRCRCRKRRCG